MKVFLPFTIGVFMLAVTTGLRAQDSLSRKGSDLKVKKYTVLAQYEDQLVLSAEERLQLKRERRDLLKKRREIIDTLDISERRRRRLLKELYRSPFSDRWDRLVTGLQLEDPEEFRP